MTRESWKARVWTIVLLPVLAAVLIAAVGEFQNRQQRKLDAEAAKAPVRSPLPVSAPLLLAREDLERTRAEDRSDSRYFSLVHRSNEPECSDDVLERERRALRAMVRLVSPPDRVAEVTALDAERLVFRVRLSELGWTADQWDELARTYRYGTTHADSSDVDLARADEFVREAVGHALPVVRADWFVAALLRPPLGGPGGSLGLWTKTPPEDLRLVAEAYAGCPVGLETAARELGAEPQRVRDLIASDEMLHEAFGLAPLLRGQTVPREWWESGENLASPYQELGRRLGTGRPIVRR